MGLGLLVPLRSIPHGDAPARSARLRVNERHVAVRNATARSRLPELSPDPAGKILPLEKGMRGRIVPL